MATESGVLVVIAGPTAAGKSEAQKGLMRLFPEVQKIVTYTSRDIRSGEVDGEDYNFVDTDTFVSELDAGQFLEFDNYGGKGRDKYYGTKTADLLPLLSGTNLTWILTMPRALDIDGYIRQAFSHDPQTAQKFIDQKVTMLVTTPDRDQLRERFLRRGGTLADYEGRVLEDLNFVDAHRDEFEHVILNEEGMLSETINQAASIFEQKRQTVKNAPIR